MKKHFLLLVALATLLAACHKTEEQKEPDIIVPENIAVVYISLNQFELVLQPGETAVIKATVGPDNATDKTVSWSSSRAWLRSPTVRLQPWRTARRSSPPGPGIRKRGAGWS